jgi:8-oxo-dGTP pyrophosphatase MutT (NUDIX family)
MYSNTITSPDTRVKAGVGVIIVDDQERILLEQRYDNGMWGLPGGGIEPGESVFEAALREVKEETGLDIRIKGLLGIYSEPAEGTWRSWWMWSLLLIVCQAHFH